MPLVGLENRFEREFWRRYTRRTEWDPVWKVEGDRITIKFYLTDLDFVKAQVSSTKDFLNIWGKISDRVVSNSKALYFVGNYVTDETYIFEKIENIKDYIEKVLNVIIPIPYVSEEEDLWKSLYGYISESKTSSFNFLAENILNIKRFEIEKVLDTWKALKDKFPRWILKWYILNKEELKNTYTYKVFKNLKDFGDGDLLREYVLEIFNLEEINEDIIKERRDLLRDYYDESPKDFTKSIEEEFKAYLTGIKDKEIPKYLVGVFDFEKEWIIQNFDLVKANLEEFYPELYYYLEPTYAENLEGKNNWIEDYFKEYKWSKIKNSPTENLLRILEEKNRNSESFYDWYYKFEKTKNLIKEDAEKIVFVDGLGVEFLSLFQAILKKKGFDTEIYIGVSELPTITEVNKIDFYERIDDLDKFIHDQNPYKYPQTLIEELKIVKNIAEYISGLGDDLLIVSDHGFTFVPLFSKSKRYNFDAEHEGRCMELKNGEFFTENEDFFVHELERTDEHKRYLIALKTASLSDIPRREVHGGASPEEVLVPIIHATKQRREKEKYEVRIINEQISFRAPELRISVSPKPRKQVYVEYMGKIEKMEFDKENRCYKVMLKEVKLGKLPIRIKIGSWESEYEIEIIGGIKERDIL